MSTRFLTTTAVKCCLGGKRSWLERRTAQNNILAIWKKSFVCILFVYCRTDRSPTPANLAQFPKLNQTVYVVCDDLISKPIITLSSEKIVSQASHVITEYTTLVCHSLLQGPLPHDGGKPNTSHYRQARYTHCMANYESVQLTRFEQFVSRGELQWRIKSIVDSSNIDNVVFVILV